LNKKVSIILPYYNRKNLLLNTLKSFNKFYENKNVEVVIIDDGSNSENRLEDSLNFNLNIKLIRLENKNGINPCYPYNVGVRNSSGDIIILSSPETFHTKDMFDISNNFKKLTNETYLLFSVFCLTDITKLENIEDQIPKFHKNLGINGYSYNNNIGSWYCHSKYRPNGLNFLSAITRENYYKLSGFDERFRFGTGFDDTEFRDRLIDNNIKFIYLDDAIAIHVNHEVVNNSLPTTNLKVYLKTKNYKYKFNDKWGKY